MATLFPEAKGLTGPPHAIPMAGMRALAEALFEVLHLAEATENHPRRAEQEFLMIARRR